MQPSRVDILGEIRQNLGVMKIRQQSLEARIERIKEEIARLGELRPGALSQQYNVCGNPKCRCKANPPMKHGPYYQLSYTWRGKSTTRFVRKENLAQVKQQVRNYRRLTKLVDRWVALSMELSRLRLQKEFQQVGVSSKTRRKSRVSEEKRALSIDS
jgi:uncharacterized protein YukE